MNLGEYAASQANRFEFFSGVPIDATQTRQLFFASAADRDEYFDSLPKYYSANNAKYVKRDGTLKAAIPPTTAVNYMRFKNVGGALSKWFYAFVNRVDYLNPSTSIVTWTLDVYQTFIHECTFGDCSISRQTQPSTMSQYDNVLPEGVDYGDYRVLTIREILPMKPEVYVVCSTVDLALSGRDSRGNPLLQSCGGSIIQGTPTCNDIIICRTKEKFVSLMNTLIDYPWVAQCVQGVYGLPSWMVRGISTTSVRIGSETYERVRNSKDTPTPHIIDLGNILPIDTGNTGVMPDFKYRKLWQYPYTFFEVASPDGGSLILKPELFNFPTVSMKATVYAIISPVPSALVIIQNYGGSHDLFTFTLTIDNFPTYPVPNDQYYARQTSMNASYALNRKQAAENLRIGAQYINTNLGFTEAHNIVSLAGNAMGMFDPTAWTLGGITGHATSAAHTAISSQEAWVQAQQQKEIANRMEQQAAERERLSIDQNQTAVTLAGRLDAGAFPVLNALGAGASSIYFRVWTITDKAAERLSQYFDAFGVKYDRIEQPQFRRGKRYHYVRMSNVNLYGPVPQDYLFELQNIFLDGVTLWKDHENVGIYGDNDN